MPSQMLYKNGLLYVAGSSVINYDNQTVFVYAYNVSANYAYVSASACCVIEPARLGYSRVASCSGYVRAFMPRSKQPGVDGQLFVRHGRLYRPLH